ncbi:hypothetical protein EDD18DRAFT_1358984 [Armillaria luteobubalina]|uniref:Uncharacterized protein n=1 Tax=Armillaria luteobubalina TaxID=153913 RepID=A0AA39UHU7_9AGAR|nr:hypothetical protein EDD18DRAFT_1358984 [Armillaria luteobubalina]
MDDELLKTEYHDAITFCNNSSSQLAGYGDIQRVLAETMVDSESQPDASFIVSQDSREEMVFHMQGIVLEVALPPVRGNNTHNQRVSVNQLQQSVTIVGLDGDRQFTDALAAISCMLDLLSQSEANRVRALQQMRTGHGAQVTFCNRLLTPSHMVSEEDVVALPAAIDPHNMLSKELQPNKFSFTEDSKVSLEKYNRTPDGQYIHTIDLDPRIFCPGQVVNRLDSMALMSTMGASLVQSAEMASRNHEVRRPLPCKRRQEILKMA